jgi:hypothetical protein
MKSESRFFRPLLRSAQEFFSESLRQYERNKLNLAIVSCYTAIELLAKARMCMVHDSLRLDSLNERKKGNTIKWSELQFRLELLDVRLTTDEQQLMTVVSGWRNDIVHAVPAHDNQSAKARLPQLFEFISNFSTRELGVGNRLLTLHEQKQLRSIYQNVVATQKKARKEAKAAGKVIGLPCPNCGLHGTVSQKAEAEDGAFCHFCRSSFVYRVCRFCPRKVLGQVEIDGSLWHDACGDEYFKGYADYLASEQE